MQYYAHRKQTVTNELKSAVQKRLLPALITRDVPSAETEAASSSASQIDANTALPDAYSQVAAAAAVAYAALPDGADDVPAQPSSASSSNSATSDAASAPASSDVDPATNKLHRADVYISTKPKSDSILNTQGQQIAIDVTGTHPVTGLFPSRRGEPAVRGKQAEARAAAKHKHYNNRYDTNILDVIPFVLETGGFINREGRAFILTRPLDVHQRHPRARHPRHVHPRPSHPDPAAVYDPADPQRARVPLVPVGQPPP